MHNKVARFIPLFIFTLVLLLLALLSREVLLLHFIHPTAEFIILFLFLQALLTLFLTKLGLRDKSRFSLYYMAATVFRFLLSIIVIFFALYLGVNQAVIFIVNFMIAYLLFVVFEIYTLITNLRPDSEKHI
jgi:hypothetical protein